ncbi:MAG: molybdopterin molybdenumtransferase MoeA, partial [Oscillospiraceae bacterium]|nr:molybdopterin molybdenumtransferase MoeA [Oscillospiraceae bacterium]
KTKLKPGGAMLASHLDGKLILALSGNPGSALMGLLHIARPFLRRRAGWREFIDEPILVRLRKPIMKENSRTRLLRGFLEIEDGAAYFAEEGEQGGGALSSFASCDLLGEIPQNTSPLAAGALIRAFRI